MLLAIDAEFVMFSPEEKVAEYGVETVTRPARLGLARISVLRGDPGPCSGGTLKPGPGPGEGVADRARAVWEGAPGPWRTPWSNPGTVIDLHDASEPLKRPNPSEPALLV